MKRVAAAAALALGLLLATAAPAAAHAQLVATDPAAGAALRSAPRTVTVVFDEAVLARPDALQVHDRTGARVDGGGLRRVQGGRGLRLALPELPDGGYVVTWRVVSADGHPISGGVTWRVGSGKAVDQSLLQRMLDAEGGDTGLHALAAVTRTLLFAALVVLVGGLAFVLFVWPDGASDPRVRRTFVGAALAALVATALSMAIEGADIAGLGIGRVLSWTRVVDAWGTPFGKAAAARLLLVAVLGACAWALPRLPIRALVSGLVLGTVSAATLASLSLGGHARTGRWTALALPLDVVHLYSGALWFGGLAVLTLLVLPRLVDDTGVVDRFSRLAAACVGVVTLTGAVQGYRQLGTVRGLRSTDYGRVLVIKVVLVALVAVLGGLSRSLVRARHQVDDDVDVADLRRRLRRSVGFEACVGVAVLAATSVLVAANPNGAAADAAFSAAKVVRSTVIETTLVPARTGPVTVHVYASDPSAGLTATFGATATMALPSRGITGIQVPIRRTGRAHWSAYGFVVPIRGDWRLTVTVTIGDLVARTTTFDVTVR